MGIYYPSKEYPVSQRQPHNSSREGMPSEDIIAGTLQDNDQHGKVDKPNPKPKAPLKKQRSWFLW